MLSGLGPEVGGGVLSDQPWRLNWRSRQASLIDCALARLIQYMISIMMPWMDLGSQFRSLSSGPNLSVHPGGAGAYFKGQDTKTFFPKTEMIFGVEADGHCRVPV